MDINAAYLGGRFGVYRLDELRWPQIFLQQILLALLHFLTESH